MKGDVVVIPFPFSDAGVHARVLDGIQVRRDGAMSTVAYTRAKDCTAHASSNLW